MRVYASCAAAALVVAATSSVARAQQSWSPFVAFSSAPSGGPLAPSATSPGSMVLEPGALLESSRGSMLARWSATFDQRLPALGDAELASRTRFGTLNLLGGLESSIYTSAHYDRGGLGTSASADAAFRLQLGSTSPSHGIQLGLGADSWRVNRDAELLPASTVSAWFRRFGLSFTAEVSAHTLPGARLAAAPGDTAGSPSRPRIIDYYIPVQVFDTLTGKMITVNEPHYQEVSNNTFTEARTFGETRFRVSGTLLSLGLDAQIGRTMATKGASRSFGSLILTHWLSQSIGLTGGVVLQPPEPGGLIGRSGGLLGIRLATGPRGVPSVVNAPKTGVVSTTVRSADGTSTLQVRAAGAGHVEVSGDFTHWLPVALDRAGGDRWTLTTALSPGIHRLVIRVDGGAWLPPPGLPQAADPYEGNVGVIVVE